MSFEILFPVCQPRARAPAGEKNEKSFTAAYNRIVAFITHYNEKLCTDIDSDSEGDDE